MQKIDTIADFKHWINSQQNRQPAAFQGLDLSKFKAELTRVSNFEHCLFLGCKLDPTVSGHIASGLGILIPDSPTLAFATHRSKLYAKDELFSDYCLHQPTSYEHTLDYKIYAQYLEQGKDKPDSIAISLNRRLHDHSITDALKDFIVGKKVVAIMGGHGMTRGQAFYAKIAKISRTLTRDGFLMISGGGPGAMEATHLGAYFATRSESDLVAAIAELKQRPAKVIASKEYQDSDWLQRAFGIIKKYPLSAADATHCASVGIPTWLYGHEPPSPFATHTAKYFANSVREDGLLAIATNGVIFAPGSAGTTQEIFQDACQNHYGTAGVVSPMILMGRTHWTEHLPVWPLLQQASEGKKYQELIALTDSVKTAVDHIKNYEPNLYKV